MTDEKVTPADGEAKDEEQPKRRAARKTDAPAKDSEAKSKVEPAPYSQVEPEGRVIKEGEDIEVNADDEGVAQEDVWLERDMANTNRKMYTQVSRKGVILEAGIKRK